MFIINVMQQRNNEAKKKKRRGKKTLLHAFIIHEVTARDAHILFLY
jgi:hypothetical protein